MGVWVNWSTGSWLPVHGRDGECGLCGLCRQYQELVVLVIECYAGVRLLPGIAAAVALWLETEICSRSIIDTAWLH